MDRILYKEANGDLTCRARDFDKVFPTLYAYEELELTPEDIKQTLLNFGSFLCEITGGRMSKTNYTVQAMVDEAYANFERGCDECSDRQELAEIREKLKRYEDAEEEGRLIVLPCSIDSPVYLIHQESGQKRKPKTYRVDECDIDHFTIGETMIPMITAVSKDNEWHELIDGTQEGYEYWLTREAAEAALAKDNNVPGKKEG